MYIYVGINNKGTTRTPEVDTRGIFVHHFSLNPCTIYKFYIPKLF